MSNGTAILNLENKEIIFSGNWTVSSSINDINNIFNEIKNTNCSRIKVLLDHDSKWDSIFIVVLLDLLKESKALKIEVNLDFLPKKILKLLSLSKDQCIPQEKSKIEESSVLNKEISNTSKGFMKRFLESDKGSSLYEIISFFGEWLYVHILLFQGKVKFRSKDYFELLRNSSIEALPIITLISFLSGVVLAYVGLVQLETFGAEILIANLIGFGVLRDMGALMSSVVMSGRTGASYAAQLGTMNANDEIDALSSFNINPMHFLVIPRTLALIFMMPLLTIYADIIGLIAGAVIACSTTDISITEYYTQTVYALGFNDFLVGIVKSVAFGIIIAFFGCYYGIYSGKKAQDVGNSATRTVVTSIVFIVIFDALFTVFFSLVKF